MKKFFNDLFYQPQKSNFIRVNNFLSFVTVIAISSLIFETVPFLKENYTSLFRGIEWAVTVIFLGEYVGRIIGTSHKFKYLFSFFGIIDLLAIIPTLLGLGNFTFLKSLRGLRILRFLRMLRIAKLVELQKRQHKKARNKSHEDDKIFFITLQIYVSVFWFAALLSGTVMWIFEGYRDVFSNIPVAVLWALKVLLGGTPQAMPDTITGEIVVILTRFLGVILFALLINIILNPIKKYFLPQEGE